MSDVLTTWLPAGCSGWRPSVVSKTYQHAATMMTQEILRTMKPRGPGGFDFLSVGGKPVLTDVNTGRFNGAHSPKLFVELYAPQVIIKPLCSGLGFTCID